MEVLISLSVVSPLFLIVSLYLFQKASQKSLTKFCFFLMAVSTICLFIIFLVANFFTGQGIDHATIFHLQYGLEGAGFGEYRGIIVASLALLILNIVFLLWFLLAKAFPKQSDLAVSAWSFFFLFFSLLLSPAFANFYNLNVLSNSEGVNRDEAVAEEFLRAYRQPTIINAVTEPRNFVLIFAESLERSYFNQQVFPGLMQQLRELEAKSTYFTNITQAERTGWTVAGIVASQCGIPMFSPSYGNAMGSMDRFLPSATCLGDLLSAQGYELTFMGGAHLDFAGKGKLFKSHGYSTVLGLAELYPAHEPKRYLSQWGLYDDSLLDMVYDRFIELSEAKKRFGLVTLTLDTHHPNGHPSYQCNRIKYQDGTNPILNSVACSDYLIAKLVYRIRNSPFSKNTVVIIASDHLAMRNTASHLLDGQERKNLLMILPPDGGIPSGVETAGSTLDIGVTLLSFLGYEGRLGLGRNLLDDSEQTRAERQWILENLGKWGSPLEAFWDFPQVRKSLEINIDTRMVRIDGSRNFQLPILIELNESLESKLVFPYDIPTLKNALVKYRRNIADDKYFILVDWCSIQKELDPLLGNEGLCLLAGKGLNYSTIKKLERNILFDLQGLDRLLKKF